VPAPRVIITPLKYRARGGMFGSSLYDPNAPWRSEPATASQYRVLLEREIHAPVGLTKGQASDLISRYEEPGPDELEFLQFFRVKLPRSATQLDARDKIAEIISDPSNKTLWDARPASSEQKEWIRLVDGKVPKGLTQAEAERLIRSYYKDEAKSLRLQAVLDDLDEQGAVDDAKENRLSTIKHTHESLNREPSAVGLRRVSMNAVRDAIEALERQSGQSLDQLEDDEWFLERIAAEIRKADPTKSSKDAISNPGFFQPWASSSRQASQMNFASRASAPPKIRSGRAANPSGGSSWIGALVIVVLALVALRKCTGG
jgi:hypothetical protein